MLGHEAAEIPRRVPRERRLREMRVLREEAFRFGFEIGEVATATPRDANLLSRFLGMIED